MRALRRSDRRVPGTTYAVVSVSHRHSPARDFDDAQQALAAAGVGQLEGVSGLRLREQIAVDRNRRIVDVGLVHARDEPHARRLGHAADRVAQRPPFRDRRPGLDRPGAQLGSGEVEGDCAALAGLALGAAQVLDHPLPDLGLSCAQLMRMTSMPASTRSRISAGWSAASPGIVTMIRVAASAARGTEDRVGVLGEQRVAGVEHDRRRPGDRGRHRLVAEREEHLQHRLQRCHDVRLHAAQRAQAQPGKLVLQLAHVVPAHGEVVDEVVGALAHRRRRRVELGGELLLGRQRRPPQLVDAAGGAVEAQGAGDFAFGAASGGHRGEASICCRRRAGRAGWTLQTGAGAVRRR